MGTPAASGTSVQTAPVPSATMSATDNTSPVNSNAKVQHRIQKDVLLAPLWKNDVEGAAVSKNVHECLQSDFKGTKGDRVAFLILTENLEDQWHEEIIGMSAFEAFQHLTRKFEGGFNQSMIDSTSSKLYTGKMGDAQTISNFVLEKFRLARIMKITSFIFPKVTLYSPFSLWFLYGSDCREN